MRAAEALGRLERFGGLELGWLGEVVCRRKSGFVEGRPRGAGINNGTRASARGP
ncbi:hypothetical protein AKJ08_2667 [Vulgatibacter incomptus]|uniref:Uncharacterized protein n=1 Tax=Vulgatibacter incomptus TaxID=1391653 RepID=A0A0K1PFJ1_9BACT|nr:hypothetical protein AKJ08_2667 [Vulgatibacter incomptus]